MGAASPRLAFASATGRRGRRPGDGAVIPVVATRSATASRPLVDPEVWRGARTMLPLLVGYLPFGLMLGATIARHPEPLAAWAGTLLIFGGSSHLAVVQSSELGAALPVVIATGLLVHARLAVYSLDMAPHWAHASLGRRLAAAATLIDPSWAVAAARYGQPGSADDKWRYHVGAVLVLAAGWLAMVTAGVLVGGSAVEDAGLGLAAPLCMLALVVPRLTDRASIAAATSAAAVALLGAGLPAGTGLLAAIAVGTVAGLVAGDRT